MNSPSHDHLLPSLRGTLFCYMQGKKRKSPLQHRQKRRMERLAPSRMLSTRQRVVCHIEQANRIRLTTTIFAIIASDRRALQLVVGRLSESNAATIPDHHKLPFSPERGQRADDDGVPYEERNNVHNEERNNVHKSCSDGLFSSTEDATEREEYSLLHEYVSQRCNLENCDRKHPQPASASKWLTILRLAPSPAEPA